MAVCSTSLGYNWNDQARMGLENGDGWGGAIYLTAFKVLDYCPLISVITGIFKVILGVMYIKANWSEMETCHKWDFGLFIARGVVSTLQLGFIFIPIDLVMTAINMRLSYLENDRSGCRVVRCRGR